MDDQIPNKPLPATAEGQRTEPDAQEKALVQRWLKRIEKKRKSPEFKAHCKAVKDGRKQVAGKVATRGEDADSEQGGVKVNLLFAKIAGAEQRVYAKNPQMTVTPEEQVEAVQQPGQPTDPLADAQKQAMSQFCKTAEVLLGRAFVKEGRLKDRAKTAVRRAFTARVAWAKVSYSKDKRQDPLILNQLKDSQDNAMRLEAMLKRLRSPDRISQTEADLAEVQQQMASLQQQSEVTVSEGIVIDILEPTAVLVLKENRTDFNDFLQAPAIVHSELYTREELEEMFPDLVAADIEQMAKMRRDGQAMKPGSEGDSLSLIHEIWSQADQTVYCCAEGLNRWLRAPWVPAKQGERWYPFFPLAFYLVDGSEYPLSAPELLQQLQDDYERTRQMQEEHRDESMPAYFTAGGSMDEADIKAVVERKANEVTVLKGWNPGVPFDQVIARFQPVPMNPAVYDTGPIRADMEMVFGVSDAATGGTVEAKTATEAQIVEAQFGERVNSFVDTVEDWIGEMGHYALEILLLELNEGQVQQLCGPAAVWPQLSREEIYENIRVQVLAGSTSKPNKRMERETWMQFLPQLMQMMTAYMTMMTQGNAVAANAVKAVARETARRFDERINVDQFFPDAPPQPQLPGMQPGAEPANPQPDDPQGMPPQQDPSGAAAMPQMPLTAAAAQSADMLPSPAQVQ